MDGAEGTRALDGIAMEAFISLGCIVEKSATTLRLTSDPKERRPAALFAAVFGFVPLLVILFVPFSQVGWAGIMVFGGFGIAWLLVAFLIGFCRTEITFDLSRRQVVRRRFCLGRVRSVSVLPLSQLKIQVVEGNEDTGALLWVRTDGQVWAKWIFLDKYVAQETRQEILAWLRERSVYAALEQVKE